MATGERYLARLSHDRHFLPASISPSDNHVFDFDESDVWSTGTAIDDGGFQNQSPGTKKKKKKSGKKSGAVAASSLPMNIPDWSKILRGDYRENRHGFELEDDEDFDAAGDEEGGVRFPPHEFLARQRRHQTASFSVHEGIGRTLKGRDLSRVRNAIWKQTGFED
uniref:Senescence regulator n=1 Tax=Kalanchoe fedtschenkoi TaxID=63787 RepID=A0A7N1A357_KALFE